MKRAIVLVALSVCIVGCSDGAVRNSQAQTDAPGSTRAGGETASDTRSQTAEAPASDEFAAIRTPSGNVDCLAWVYGPGDEEATMRCYIDEISVPDLPRPDWAHCDWEGGRLFELPPTGPGRRASFCDAIPARPGTYRDETVAYGRTWRHGPYICLSSRLGLLCTNANGHGLFLSREQQRPF
jgi:hypothetical protein